MYERSLKWAAALQLVGAAAFAVIGSLLASFPVEGMTPAGIVATYDNYLIVGNTSGSVIWRVYTTTGSLVRTYAGYPALYDGTGECHLGHNYVVVSSATGGVRAIGYSAGGHLGSLGGTICPATGRGVGWNGQYYYATTGTWSTPIGVYTTTGSLVNTLYNPLWAPSLFGHATPTPADGYVIAAVTDAILVLAASSGNLLGSLSFPGTPAGVDINNGLLYIVRATPSPAVYIFDYGGAPIAAVSMGRIKAIYR